MQYLIEVQYWPKETQIWTVHWNIFMDYKTPPLELTTQQPQLLAKLYKPFSIQLWAKMKSEEVECLFFFSETGIRGPFLEDQRHFVLLSSASPTRMSYKPSKGVASPSHNNLPYTVFGIFPVESSSLAYFHIQLCHTELSSFCPFCLWPGCLRNRKPILWLHNITVVFSYRSKWGI